MEQKEYIIRETPWDFLGHFIARIEVGESNSRVGDSFRQEKCSEQNERLYNREVIELTFHIFHIH